MQIPEGYSIEQFTAHQPNDASRYALKWDGEWHITYEVFRDLGRAFGAVLILIYILVVGWFRSFVTPIMIMAAIPSRWRAFCPRTDCCMPSSLRRR